MHTLKTTCDFIILELTVPRVTPDARTLLEMSTWLDDLGFCITDFVGGVFSAAGDFERRPCLAQPYPETEMDIGHIPFSFKISQPEW